MKICPQCRNEYPDDYQTCPRDRATLETPGLAIVPGTVLRGKYEVIDTLGAGGMATVYKVRHRAFHEIAAVKVVHPHFMHDPDFVKRFRNEAVVARQLKHPNAVRIDDFDSTEDGRPFIVMEYVEGRTLYEVRCTHPEPWPLKRCLDIAMQTVGALGAAHALGIVHRDIKPSNILLVGGNELEGQVKVLDFGISKVSGPSFAGMTAVLTEQSLIIGTPAYMSPEQAAGRSEAAIDGRSDLYSLGLVMYEMLTGSHPFQADTPMGMLIQQLQAIPAPPTSFRVPVTPAISALVLKSLAKEPKDRFQSAGEMLAAMQDPETWFRRENAQSAATIVRPKVAATTAPPKAPAPPPPKPVRVAPPIPAPQPPKAGGRGQSGALIAIVLIAAALAAVGGRFFYQQAHPMPGQQADATPAQAAPVASVPEVNTTPAPVADAPVVVAQPVAVPAPKAAEAAKSPGGRKTASEFDPVAIPVQDDGSNAPVETPPPIVPVVTRTPTPASIYDGAYASYRAKNYSVAAEGFERACDLGKLEGCRNAGVIYDAGTGVPKDTQKADTLFKRGCDGGHFASCTYLGLAYANGTGVNLNPQMAAILYLKACNGNDRQACRNLAIQYATGKGINPDLAKAKTLYQKACGFGDQPSCEALKSAKFQ